MESALHIYVRQHTPGKLRVKGKITTGIARKKYFEYLAAGPEPIGAPSAPIWKQNNIQIYETESVSFSGSIPVWPREVKQAATYLVMVFSFSEQAKTKDMSLWAIKYEYTAG